jgi:flavin-dependent thymidylate synthase
MNKVELIGHYGSDEIIALAAWTSTSRELSDEKRNRVPQLIHTLAGEGHHTPFERGVLHFLLTVDDKTHIQLLKHRISSANGESARYKEIKHDAFYVPDDFPKEWKDKLSQHSKVGNELYHTCLNSLVDDYGFSRARAKESARYFKGQNTQLTLDFMINMRSFFNFQKLRNSPDAQLEIRELSQAMLTAVKEIQGNPFQHTIKAFTMRVK